MEQGSKRPSRALRRLVNGYQVSQAIHVAATLGIADFLKDGPRSSDDLAATTGAHPRALYRLLRALAAQGVFREMADRRFALTPLGACLCADAPEPVGPWAAFIGQPSYWQVWGRLEHSVRTGESAFPFVHGADPWEYRARHPEEGVIFDRAMTGVSRAVAGAVLASYDFGRFASIVDVGGGHGAFLAAILTRYSAARGILFDQPHVVAGAEPELRAAGVIERCAVVGGSFFEAVPEGGDAYVLKAVVHDWDDEGSTTILRSCRRAIRPDGTLLIVESVVGPPNEEADTAFSDLNMLVAPGGQERTRHEFDVLVAAAGFRLTGVTPTESMVSVVECVPA